jgi:hypothetical protein
LGQCEADCSSADQEIESHIFVLQFLGVSAKGANVGPLNKTSIVDDDSVPNFTIFYDTEVSRRWNTGLQGS